MLSSHHSAQLLSNTAGEHGESEESGRFHAETLPTFNECRPLIFVESKESVKKKPPNLFSFVCKLE